METGCVVCQYIQGKLVPGMLPVTTFETNTKTTTARPAFLCLDLRDRCPHTAQFLRSITIPTGINVKIAEVGGSGGWTPISGYAEIATTAGSRYTLMLQENVL